MNQEHYAELDDSAIENAAETLLTEFFDAAGQEVTIPVPVAKDGDAHEWWEEVHEFMWKPIAFLIALHILGALYNHFIAKNDVLRRMTVGVK